MGIQATNYYLLLKGTYGVLYRYRYCFLLNVLPLEVFQYNNLLIHSKAFVVLPNCFIFKENTLQVLKDDAKKELVVTELCVTCK